MDEFIAEFQKISAEAKRKFGTLSSEQINWKPSAEKWSIAQCFEHLIVTNSLYFPNIQKVINDSHSNNFFSKIPFSTNLIAFAMKNSLKPDQKRKMRTFKVFEPSASDISSEIIEDFVENNQKLFKMIEACKDLDLHKIKIAEPLSPTLNLRLDDAFEILLLHEHRHFLQAERVLTLHNFPQ